MEKNINYNGKKVFTPSIINNHNEAEIKLLDFQKKNQLYLLQLELKSIRIDNYRIFLKDRYLTLVVSEIRELEKPVYLHNMSWQEVDSEGYEVMKNIELWLPGDNFYLVKHFFVPASNLLNIYLGRSSEQKYA